MNATNILRHLLVGFKTNYINQNSYAFVKYNNLCLEILFILYKDGLIDNYEIDSDKKIVKIKLKYFKNKPLIKDLSLISKPSHKKFIDAKSLKEFNLKYDYFFISTSKGLISSRNLNLNENIGGQILFGLTFNNNN